MNMCPAPIIHLAEIWIEAIIRHGKSEGTIGHVNTIAYSFVRIVWRASFLCKIGLDNILSMCVKLDI